MLPLELKLRALGLLRPDVHRRRVQARRAAGLLLSSTEYVDSLHAAPVTRLNIDRTSGRYLLSCDLQGGVSIYDLEAYESRKSPSFEQFDDDDDGMDRKDFEEENEADSSSSSHYYFNKPIGRIRSLKSSQHCCQWYPTDPGLFITGGHDGKIRIWDASAPVELIDEIRLGFSIRCCSIPHAPGANTSIVAACGEGPSIRLCDMGSGTSTHTIDGHEANVNTIAWSPSEPFTLLSGSNDLTIRAWDIRNLRTCTCIFDQELGPDDARWKLPAPVGATPPSISPFLRGASKFGSPAFEGGASFPVVSRKRRRGSSGAGKRRPRPPLKAKEGTLMQERKRYATTASAHASGVTHLAYTSDGRRVVSSGRDGRLRLWHADKSGANMMVHYEFTSNTSKMLQFAISPHDDCIAYPDKRSIKIYDMKTGVMKQKLSGHFDPPLCCVFKPRKSTMQLFTAGADHSILKWTSQKEDAEILAELDQRRQNKMMMRQKGGGTGGYYDYYADDGDDWTESEDEGMFGNFFLGEASLPQRLR